MSANAVNGNGNDNRAVSFSQAGLVYKHWTRKWTLENFSQCPDTSVEEMVVIEMHGKTFVPVLTLMLHRDHPPHSSIVVLRARINANAWERAKWQLRFMDSSGQQLYFRRADVITANRLELLAKISTDDRLIIIAEVAMVIEEIRISNNVNLKTVHSVVSANNRMLNDAIHTDFRIIVGDQEIRVHRAVLATCSPVFAAMFNHENTAEAQSGTLTISDAEFEVVNQMLQFIYDGNCSDSYEDIVQLLAMAEKYGIESLKQYCQAVLVQKHLTIDRVCDLLSLAEIHFARSLRSGAIDFVVANAVNVLRSPGWLQLQVVHPHLGIALFERTIQLNNRNGGARTG